MSVAALPDAGAHLEPAATKDSSKAAPAAAPQASKAAPAAAPQASAPVAASLPAGTRRNPFKQLTFEAFKTDGLRADKTFKGHSLGVAHVAVHPRKPVVVRSAMQHKENSCFVQAAALAWQAPLPDVLGGGAELRRAVCIVQKQDQCAINNSYKETELSRAPRGSTALPVSWYSC